MVGYAERAPRMTHVFYSPDYAGAGHEFDTTRKSRWIADSLARSPVNGIELVEPTPLTAEQILSVGFRSFRVFRG